MIKSTSFGSRMRKRLSDITNLHSQHRSPFKNRENTLPAAMDDSSSKNYIEQLHKENAVMMKLLEEKDKMIVSNEIELQKLRVHLQKSQLQNWQLAQSNSQMLAELNRAKDRLQTLQHELLCKDALFKAVTIEPKDGETKLTEEAAVEQPLEHDNNKDNKVSKPKRRRPARSKSMGTTSSQQIVDKETLETKRRCVRRQSVALKPPENREDLFEIDVANNHVNQAANFSHRKSTDSECHSESTKCTGGQRSSIGRPQRRASEKVQSYKDPPLNTKMRRPE